MVANSTTRESLFVVIELAVNRLTLIFPVTLSYLFESVGINVQLYNLLPIYNCWFGSKETVPSTVVLAISSGNPSL